jgi:hypothetical protein
MSYGDEERYGDDPYRFDDDEYGDDPLGDDAAADDGSWDEEPPARQGGLRLLVGVAALLVALGLVAALQKAGDDDDDVDDDEVATQEDRSTTTRRAVTSTTLGLPGGGAASSVVPGASSTTSSTAPKGSTTTKKPATTTTVDEDAPEPACVSGGGGAATPAEAGWATRWQTMPQPNDPATVSICVDDITPKVGQTVTLSISGADPDAMFPTTECGTFVTWEGSHASHCRDFVIAWNDPRPTPKQEPGQVLQHFAHVYDTPGQKTITGSVWSAEYDGYTSPYSSRAIAALQVTVHA